MRFLISTILAFVFSLGIFQLLPSATYASANQFTNIQSVKAATTSIQTETASVIEVFEEIVDVHEFSISIPKIRVNKQIKPNVNPSNPDIYLPVIEEYVAHGMFTRLPSQAVSKGNVYLFAHRNGASGFFNRLDELQNGDEISIRFNSKTYGYTVSEKFIIEPTDTWVYTASADKPSLTLQTCEDGTAKRLIIKAVLKQVS